MSAVDAVDSGQTEWSTRAPLWAPTWNHNPAVPCWTEFGKVDCDVSTPWEVLIRLANEAKRDLWINVPPNATAEYVTGLATLLKETLDPTLVIYIEYSNEVWNWTFETAKWNLNAAVQEVTQGGDPGHLDFDKCGNHGYWAWRRVAWKLASILDQFDAVFGKEARNVRFRGVYASQIGGGGGTGDWGGGAAQNALLWTRHQLGMPGDFFYAIAGAPYFGLGEATHWANLTADMVLNISRQVVGDMIPNAGNNWTASAVMTYGAMARWNGLRFVGYEGGPDYAGDIVQPGANRSIP